MDKPASTDKHAEKPGTLWLTGRIKESQQVGTDKENFPIIETIFTTPAPDPHSHPNKYCIMSRSKLGAPNDDLTIEVEVQCRPWKDSKGKWHYPHYLWAVR
jgi:hypothetical protein